MASLKSLFVDKFLSVWWIVVTLLLILPFAVWLFSFTTANPNSNTCRTFTGHEICINSIRRSAQRYWEYRAVVSIDGKKQPLEIYNCRDRNRILASDGTIVPFLTGKTGDWICTLTQPNRSKQIRERGEIVIR